VILRWHVIEGLTAGEYHLRLANRAGVATYSFLSASPGVPSAATAGIQTFDAVTPIPINTGQAVALAMSPTASIGLLATESEIGSFAEWAPNVADGVTQEAQTFGEGTIGYNVEMQPAPTITSHGATSGPTTGGTAVPISGTDFANVTGVSFGSTLATSFSVRSEGALPAVAPAGTAAGAVTVTVMTIAGVASASQRFTYESPPTPPAPRCVVPNLKGKTLAAAKTAPEKAKRELGAVKKVGGATAKSGKGAKQGAKAGAKVIAGAKVAVTLEPAKAAHRKGGKGGKGKARAS
jgi:hypothetical protein